MKVERTISIARPPADVFSYISDVRNDPSWHTDVLEVQSSSDVVGVGTVFDVKVKPSMGVTGGTMTVSRLEPGRLIEFQGRMGKMAPTVTNICEPEGQGTRHAARRAATARGHGRHDTAHQADDRQEQRRVPQQSEAAPRKLREALTDAPTARHLP